MRLGTRWGRSTAEIPPHRQRGRVDRTVGQGRRPDPLSTDRRLSRLRQGPAGLNALRLSAVLVAGAFLLLGWGSASGARPAETLREQRAVSRIAARGLPLYCGGGRAREVALTFDDGPTTLAPRLVAALRRSSLSPARSPVGATFFLIGESAARYAPYARTEAEIGAVGAHTQTHTTLTRRAGTAARSEIVDGKRSVEQALGKPVRLFRPPGGGRTPAIDRIVASQNLLTVMWTVDPRDWARPSAASIVAALSSDPRLVPGAIVVLHEFHRPTIEAIPSIVRELGRRDLRPVTLPRLLADDPPTLAEQRADARAGSCVHLFRRA